MTEPERSYREARPAQAAAIGGLVTGVVAAIAGLLSLGFPFNLTATIDGVDALEAGLPTPFGWWSIGWRAAFVGLVGAALTARVYAWWWRATGRNRAS